MRLLTLFTLLTLFGCGILVSEEEQKEFDKTHKKVQKGVSDWIKKYAIYPDSYESISFSEFSQSHSSINGEKIPGSESYVIKHTHKAFNKDSNLVTFSGYFILENDFEVNIIEIKRSNSVSGAFPPRTQIWTDQFGRPLNAQDSLEFNKKQQEVKAKLIKDLREGLEKGNFEAENPEDINNLNNLMDTFERMN